MTRKVPMLVLVLAVLASGLATPAALAARGPCIPGKKKPKCLIQMGKVGPVDDGDTIKVRGLKGYGTRRALTVRLTGIQAMELTTYGKKKGRVGECNSVKAAERLEQLIRRGRSRVRVAALKKSSTTGSRNRLRRHISVRTRGRWVDVGAVLLQEGLALWFPNATEWAWNKSYGLFAYQAAEKGIGIWNKTSCGAGPSQSSGLEMKVKWDAHGTDNQNINGEWARITNTDLVNEVSLGGWWFRDSHLRRYKFPSNVSIPAGGSIQVHAGGGRNTDRDIYWDIGEPIFENVTGDKRAMGDGGYLFDKEGDLRASAQYPCRVNCSDPLDGKIEMKANMKAPEYIRLRNTSNGPLDLRDYEVESSPYFYEFGADSVLLPRVEFRLYIQKALLPGNPLFKSWNFGRYLLADRKDVVALRNPLGAPVACDAWGGVKCPKF